MVIDFHRSMASMKMIDFHRSMASMKMIDFHRSMASMQGIEASSRRHKYRVKKTRVWIEGDGKSHRCAIG